MRRLTGALMGLVVALAAMVAPGQADAVTAQEWRWMEAAKAAEASGDISGAMNFWRQLVPSLQATNVTACGVYAQKLGQALDKRGEYAEAVRYFDIEVDCWSRVTTEDTSGWYRWDQVRAEQIRPEIQAFVARPTSGTPAVGLARNEHRFGTMLGGTIDRDPAIAGDLDRVAGAYGKSYGMVLGYAEWGGQVPHVIYNEAKAAGAALQVGWNPSHGLAAVKDEAYTREFIARLKAYGHPVYLRFAPEMNGDWTEWDGDPKLYKEKFRLIADLLQKQGADNVAMVWAPNWVGALGVNPHDYYPGDDAVDWVGINVYHDPYFLGDPGSRVMDADLFYNGKRVNPLDKVKEIYRTYSARKPIMLAETGIGWMNRKPGAKPLDETKWAQDVMERFFGYLPLLYPRIKAIAYFNVDMVANPHIPGFSQYLISGSAGLTNTYRQVTAGDWYLGQGAAEPAKFWRALDQATLKGKTEVASYVNLVGGASKVEYLLDGKVVASASRLPWKATVDFTGLSGMHSFTVRAYDMQGRLGHERTYPFNASAILVDLNGRYVDFDQPPMVIGGRTLVPARAILEALGAEVKWEQATQTVIAIKDGSVVRLQLGNVVPTRDGQRLTALEVPAQAISGRTLVPTRFVAENYGLDVKWDQQNQTVLIRTLR